MYTLVYQMQVVHDKIYILHPPPKPQYGAYLVWHPLHFLNSFFRGTIILLQEFCIFTLILLKFSSAWLLQTVFVFDVKKSNLAV